MKACRVNEFGPPEAIVLEDLPLPIPAAGEVLVRVAAAGVGPWDGWIRAGKSALPQPLPLTLGSDLSGTVAAVGPNVSAFRPGEPVFGVTNPRFTGACAEYAVAQAGMIAHRPEGLAEIDAAALPVIAATAQQALFDQAGLQPGQTVLIHGGAGNVGALAVQLAHQAGLQVIATASERDAASVRSLGAGRVIDYRTARFEDEVTGVDAVIDLVGGDVQARSFRVLRPGGALISAVSEPDRQEATRRQVRAAFFLVQVTSAALNRIAALVQAGRLVAVVGTVLPLAAIRTAHEMLEGTRPHPSGKIVLRVALEDSKGASDTRARAHT
ncbi:NADP-dependent oxidoreductase [Nannocystis pusilla]|uniref:NADP-dependent oxidoreductase n=1 Tax=Nannocystis pusilla TaxID=889268 RepID=UPI0021E1513F|nr:NADP-dependent oxidoreductase [Nannocystis pusilla]